MGNRLINIIILKYASIIMLALSLFNINTKAQVSWSNIGPGGGGWLTTITIVNDSVNTVYVGCDVGGVYKSTDNGSTWKIINNGLTTYYVQDIAYNPSNPSILYVATRGGIFKSTDGGSSWVDKRDGFPEEEDFGYSAPIIDITIDKNNPNIIYAGVGLRRIGYVHLDSYYWESTRIKGAIYKSIDGGEEWSLIRNSGIDTTAMIYSLTIAPDNSNIIYAATSKGVYKSVNSGESWLSINNGLPNKLAMNIAINPVNSKTMYVTLYAEPGSDKWLGGVYKSTDDGENWTEVNNGLPKVVGDIPGFTTNYLDILIDQNNPEILYTGNYCWTPNPGIYKSVDGGENWVWISDPDKNVELGWNKDGVSVNCMAINPNNSDQLYFGTTMLLFKSDNSGDSWSQVYTDSLYSGYWRGRGLETTCVEEVITDPLNSKNIYAGYWDLGFLKSTDGGESFKQSHTGMNYTENVFSIVIDPDSTNIIYASSGQWDTNKGELCKSTDYGENWSVINTGLPDAQIWSIALDNSSINTKTIYVASYEHGIYKSSDGGKTWTLINNGLGVDGNLQINKVIVSPDNYDILYAGLEAKDISETETLQGGLFKSEDSGLNWTRIDTEYPMINVRDIIINKKNTKIIYVAVASGYDHSERTYYNGGVYKSTDGGNTWVNNSDGLGNYFNLEVSSLAINTDNIDVIYATTTDAPYHDNSSGRGIFKSIDGGKNWTPINEGLSLLNFSYIYVSPLPPYEIYACSAGNGLFKGIDKEYVGVKTNITKQSDILAISPNPFYKNTNISFSIAKKQTISIIIYNMEGQTIRTLCNNCTYPSGSHTIMWNGTDNSGNAVAAGVYMCYLKTDEYKTINKIVLTK